MLSPSFPAILPLCCLLTTLPASVHAQSTAAAPAQQPGYTFRTTTRIVLTDVTVTDRKGNPVHGLRASDFQIFDNNKPQMLASFEEHTTTPAAPIEQASTSPSVYSNEFLLHLPPVLNIIVIDITNLEIVDQMYLNYELNRFIKNLPAGQPVAIYWQSGDSRLMLQSFTSDRALLLNALHRAMPRFPPPGRGYYTDSDLVTLQAIADEFAQYPGRKNILWFSGGSTLTLHPDPMAFPGPDQLRGIYDELELDRIAIYPVDARGLQTAGWFQALAIARQQASMRDIADATGGTAFYNNNGLDKIAARWLDNGGSFYTLTYSPSDFRFDNKWHKVKVKLAPELSGCTLSYRTGYFADGSIGTAGQQHPLGKPRTRLLSNGEAVAEPDSKSLPIIFHVHIVPVSEVPANIVAAAAAVPGAVTAPPKRGTAPYFIQYTLPADAFAIKSADGKNETLVGVAVVAFNEGGSPVTREVEHFTLGIDMEKMHRTPNATMSVSQQINLHKGQNYLYMAVWDLGTGRLGTLQIPLQVAAPPKAHKP